jgi:hypothetical protein
MRDAEPVPARGNRISRSYLLSAMLLAWPLMAQQPFVADAPPVLARISVSVPDARDETTITGAAGAVLPGAWLLVINLSTGDYTTTRADAEGSFTASLVAPRGVTLEIRADPEGKIIPLFDAMKDRAGALPGTFLRVPDAPSDGASIRFSGASRRGGPFRNPKYIAIDGTIDRRQFLPGDTLVVNARMTLATPVTPESSQFRLHVTLGLLRVSTADGREIAMENWFGSTILTPTGLPIERGATCGWAVNAGVEVTFGPFADGRAESSRELTLRLPADLQPGYYQPFISFYSPELLPEPPGDPVLETIRQTGVQLPLIRVGDASGPRLVSMLFAEEWSEGTRGVRAVEDRTTYAFAPHVATQTDVLVLRRGEHRLEPYLPVMGVSDRGTSFEPRIPLKFPSGSLVVRLRRPDGSVTVLGPAPFAQARSKMPVNRHGVSFDLSGRHPGHVYQLSTMDPRFVVEMRQYGRYRIELEGHVADLWENEWAVEGTYEVIVAEPLLLDTSVLPGTPLEATDQFAFSLVTVPPVPADVEATFRVAPQSDAARTRVSRVSGRANRFGFFHHRDHATISDDGEYRVDILATHVDAHGVWWAGSRSWGGVIARPDSSLITHGRRGFLTQNPSRQPWYFKSQLGQLAPDSHVTYPFLGGDVAWLNDSAMLIAVTLQDDGPVESLIRARCGANDLLPGETLPKSSRPDGLDPHLDPSRVDLWSYAYASVQRPLIRVREVIADGRYGHQLAYWQFHEHYGAQTGVANGDLPNDFKFMFGGVVARGSALPQPQFGVYGSLFILTPKDDPHGGTRVFPPFQGNGGGPAGGPLFTLKGRDIDLFFHATAVRPATILVRGNLASFAGYSAPTLSSKIEIVVIAPSGVTRTIAGQASSIGYFHDSLQDFTADETGVWKARVKILFDGRTSAGQVTPPFPTGDVLGSREGEFYFYVVELNAPQLELAAMPQFVRPAEGPITFRVQPPAGLSNVQLTYTITMPGFILEEKTQTSMNVVYDAPTLAKDFPNLDLYDADGYAGVDTITISMMLSGTDPSGTRKHFARQVVIQGEEIQMPDQQPRQKRRAVAK